MTNAMGRSAVCEEQGAEIASLRYALQRAEQQHAAQVDEITTLRGSEVEEAAVKREEESRRTILAPPIRRINGALAPVTPRSGTNRKYNKPNITSAIRS